MRERRHAGPLLFEGSDWSFDTMRRTYDAIERIALDELAVDVYPNQIEIISSEQMLDAYSSIGMPIMYRHWSFGKHFVHHEKYYRKGMTGLAYEIVINSSPCVVYCLEDNSMPLQALVMAHAGFGHNHFFKTNHLFRQWTDAEGILDYLEYARNFILRSEERHGPDDVESLLDAAHALMPTSVFRYHRPPNLSLRGELERDRKRRAEEERAIHYLWAGIDAEKKSAAQKTKERERKQKMHLPEENLLYFIERYSPNLKPWEREILRIVRNIAQYFYPQKQTQIMNEGCASFVHYYITNRLHETGQIDDGAMLEILQNHTNVLTQPDFDDPQYRRLNPYAIGFAIMQDIKRICTEAEAEDRDWFPDFANCGDWLGVLKDAWANYRDESFIQQFLSPTVMRKFRMFSLDDNGRDNWYTVTGIHDERGYHMVRDTLARTADLALSVPDIQVADVDLLGDRVLHLEHRAVKGMPLDSTDRDATLKYTHRLWGYDVQIHSA